MFEAKAPRKTMRKVRCESAARAVPDRAGKGESPSRTASSISSMEMAPSSRSVGLSDEGGTRPSYGRPQEPVPGQGPAGEQRLPHGTSKDEAGARGTVSPEAAPALRCTW